uniref:Uncharacterized protein n=1 Tax=Rhizobium meliloti TaxID=382 RepID=Q9AGT6_RHIML|nr:unknown [Sinorhizobium meliloti]
MPLLRPFERVPKEPVHVVDRGDVVASRRQNSEDLLDPNRKPLQESRNKAVRHMHHPVDVHVARFRLPHADVCQRIDDAGLAAVIHPAPSLRPDFSKILLGGELVPIPDRKVDHDEEVQLPVDRPCMPGCSHYLAGLARTDRGAGTHSRPFLTIGCSCYYCLRTKHDSRPAFVHKIYSLSPANMLTGASAPCRAFAWLPPPSLPGGLVRGRALRPGGLHVLPRVRQDGVASVRQ